MQRDPKAGFLFDIISQENVPSRGYKPSAAPPSAAPPSASPVVPSAETAPAKPKKITMQEAQSGAWMMTGYDNVYCSNVL